MKELLNKLQNIELDEKKILAIVLFAAVLLYIDLNFIMKAQLNALNSVSPKVAKLENDLNDFNRDYAAMSKMPAQEAKETKALNLKKVVHESDVASLLQSVSDTANKLDVKILQMRPNKETSGAKDKIPGMEKLTPITINLDLVCDYHKLGQFINALEFSSNFIALQEMKVSTQAADYFKQKVSLVLKTYVKK